MRHTITVAVATRNRPESLRSTLESLQKHCTGAYDELLIVDSTDAPLNSEVMKIADIFECGYIFEKRAGLSAARNTAVRSATGQIIVFVDDDFIFHSDSIRELTRNFRNSDIAACTGRMITPERDEAALLFESLFSYDRGERSFEASLNTMTVPDLVQTLGSLGKARLGDRTPLPFKVGYGFCSFRIQAFSVVGWFDEKLGRGSAAQGGEDVDMFYRILRRGFKIRYEPRAVIFHRHRLARRDMISYAWAAGRSVGAVTRKYWKSDPYMFLMYVGALAYFTIGSLPFHGSAPLQELFRCELTGLLTSSRMRGLNRSGDDPWRCQFNSQSS